MKNTSIVDERFEAKVDDWKKRLNDLTRRNRLLYFKPTKSSTLQIAFPYPVDLFDQLVIQEKTLTFPKAVVEEAIESINANDAFTSEIDKSKEFGVIADTGAPKKITRVAKPADIVLEDPKDSGKILRSLNSKYRSAQEEHGVHVLYLVFGMLRWQETQSDDADMNMSPLVLVPVTLKRKSVMDTYTLEVADDEVQINLALQVKLEQDFGLKLPELPESDTNNLSTYWDKVRAKIARFDNWSVSEQTVIGIFKPLQQVLINDLINHQDKIKSNPVIMRLIDPFTKLNEGLGPSTLADELDDRIPAPRTFQVLDADSSQQEVIEAAKAGLSFIVQGPPGTGKSQTITNIIAEFIAARKTVLFVSEKMAALEVVYKRLQATDLDRYCLVLHSQKTHRKAIVDALTRSAENVISPGKKGEGEKIERSLNELMDKRQKLNDYVRALHYVSPTLKLGKSAFDIYSELIRLADVQRISFRHSGSDLRSTDIDMLKKRKAILEKLQNYEQVRSAHETPPWDGVRRTEILSLIERQDIRDAFATISECERHFNDGFSKLAAALQCNPPESIDQIPGILRLIDNDVMQFAASFDIRYPQTKSQQNDLKRIGGYFKPGVTQLQLSSFIEHFEKYATQTSIFKRLSSEYRQLSAQLQAVQLNQSSDVTRSEMLKLAKSLFDELKDSKSQQQRDAINTQAKQVSEYIEKFDQALSTIRSLYGDMPPAQLKESKSLPFSKISSWANAKQDQLDALPSWIDFQRVLKQAREIGLGAFISQALGTSLPISSWPDIYCYSFYEYYLDFLMQENPVLREFERETQQQIRAQFQSLDRNSFSETAKRVHLIRADVWHPTTWTGASSGEENILRMEARKQKKHKPLRKLFSEIPNLILTLRPCLLMSPLTVGQFLDPEKYRFDLVIFDEASQVPPEHAVGAILRAKQAIIVGDRKQLPPTRFFEVVDSETEDDDESESIQDVASFDSILDEADASSFPSKMLLWHYRSRDESLIAFSNYHFYDNRLVTFPSAIRPSIDGEKFLEFIFVPNGVYQRGRGVNPIEAQRVVSLITAHIRANPKTSLGVIAFSQSQQQMIEMLWEKALREDNELRALADISIVEELFIKNLETVQGDERDIIIFSIGYAKDQNGKLTLNFGPLNRMGGERRLNVAITRARQKVQLVSSIQPEDIDVNRSASQGLALLQSYMEITRDGLQKLQAELTVKSNDILQFDSPFEESVYSSLSNRGLQLHTQVGVSGYHIDLAVIDPKHPNRYIVGIECDGATYHSTATARERDRLRQDVLEGLGWHIHRIWSQSWFKSPFFEIEKILNLIEELNTSVPTPTPKIIEQPDNWAEPINPIAAKPSTAEVKNSAPINRGKPDIASQNNELEILMPDWVVEYQEAVLPHFSLDLTAYELGVYDVLKEVVQQEGPIHSETAFKRIADACGIHRLGSRIQENLEKLVALGVSLKAIEQNGAFLSIPGKYQTPVRAKYTNSEKRNIEYIPVQEIEACIYNIVKDALSLSEDDVVISTARIFGFKRVGKDVRVAIASSLQNLLSKGYVVHVDDRIQLVNQK